MSIEPQAGVVFHLLEQKRGVRGTHPEFPGTEFTGANLGIRGASLELPTGLVGRAGRVEEAEARLSRPRVGRRRLAARAWQARCIDSPDACTSLAARSEDRQVMAPARRSRRFACRRRERSAG